ncbi:hypothetical protein H5410_033830 [Solanum commersonii]|uniref:Uncharacterized protein n=1 Tax=Solanum commersonii TaxID=4109 RepID=A0A9J5YTR2_SOLCO|nr:hypothetical protein H5410_033830 [Solanum commersonii]
MDNCEQMLSTKDTMLDQKPTILSHILYNKVNYDSMSFFILMMNISHLSTTIQEIVRDYFYVPMHRTLFIFFV